MDSSSHLGYYVVVCKMILLKCGGFITSFCHSSISGELCLGRRAKGAQEGENKFSFVVLLPFHSL